MMPAMSLGQKVKALREQRDVSQQALAQAAHLTQPAISRIEQGVVQQPRLAVLKRLSEALGVSLDYLVGTAEESVGTVPPSNLAIRELLETYGRLSASQQQQVVEYARFIQAQEGKKRRTRRELSRG